MDCAAPASFAHTRFTLHKHPLPPREAIGGVPKKRDSLAFFLAPAPLRPPIAIGEEGCLTWPKRSRWSGRIADCGCKHLSELLLERPKAFMWPNGHGGGGVAVEPKSSHFETTVRRLFSPEVLIQPKITESHLTEARTPPHTEAEIRNPKLEIRNA